jgi:membrane fusion protein, multidrug efflux system
MSTFDGDAEIQELPLNRNDKLTILGLLACIPLTSCTRVSAKTDPAAMDGVPVRVARAMSQDVPLEIAAVGNVEAVHGVEVKSRIAGEITRVNFDEGQNVTQGQLLFQIDRETLDRQAAELEAQLERDAAIESQARAVVLRDAAAQKQSQSEAEVAMKLGTLGVISGQRVNQLMTTDDTTRAALHSDQAAVAAAVSATKTDRARLAQTQLQLNFADIVAPISGRAGSVTMKAGNMIRDNDTTLVTLLQLAPINVAFGVPEQSLPEIQKLNADGNLTVEAGNGDGAAAKGYLVFIDNTVDPATGTIRLKAVFPNADNSLWPGQFVQVRLRLRVEKERTLVPEASIQDGQDGKYVWLIKSGIAVLAPVNVLRTYKPQGGPASAVIGSGIHPGDTIVTEGQLRLTPGARIVLLDSIQDPSSSKTKPIQRHGA